MKRVVLFTAIILGLLSTRAHAEDHILSFSQVTTPATMEPGAPVRLAWDYETAQLTTHPVQFRLWLDGNVIKNFTSADLDSTVGATLTTFTTKAGVLPSFTIAQIGKHTLSLTAYDAIDMESDKNDLAIVVGWTSAPKPPIGLRTFTLKVALDPATGEVRFFLAEDKE
jgi:hypothetical protein